MCCNSHQAIVFSGSFNYKCSKTSWEVQFSDLNYLRWGPDQNGVLYLVINIFCSHVVWLYGGRSVGSESLLEPASSGCFWHLDADLVFQPRLPLGWTWKFKAVLNKQPDRAGYGDTLLGIVGRGALCVFWLRGFLCSVECDLLKTLWLKWVDLPYWVQLLVYKLGTVSVVEEGIFSLYKITYLCFLLFGCNGGL